VHIATIPRTRILKVNAGAPFFDDVKERQAISYAIDRAGITKVILRNPDLAATQLFPPALAGWHVPDFKPLTRDIDAAKRLLAEAGWKPGPDGILEQDGKRFSVTLLTYASWPELPPIATALQAQLREVGIDVKVSVGNSSEIPSRHQDGTLEMGLISRLYSIVPDPIGTLLQDYSAAGSDWGAMGWSNDELQALVEKLVATSNPREASAPSETGRRYPSRGVAQHSGHLVGTGNCRQQASSALGAAVRASTVLTLRASSLPWPCPAICVQRMPGLSLARWLWIGMIWSPWFRTSSGAHASRKGSAMRNLPSNTMSCCISSDHSVSQSACCAEAAIMAS
jgi:hypothetical protein